MEENHKLALYVSYYLSRFNDHALKNLGYRTWNEAFNDISQKLSVNVHSVKNWRDEFDPLFGFRVGWHQRPMSPSRKNVALALENLDELEIRSIVEDILSGKIDKNSENLKTLLEIANDSHGLESGSSFILRGPTGKKAEDFFIEYHRTNNLPIAGELIDTRDFGCGYDFEIKSNIGQHCIEVKGLASDKGGILLTNKEWEIAKQKGKKYSICIVSNVNDSPKISFINDPFSKLKPKKNIIQSVQVQWSVSNNELQHFYD